MDIFANMEKFLSSRTAVIVIAVLLCIAAFAGAFSLGEMVGYRKARFSYAWGENYNRNFGGPRQGFFRAPMMDNEFIDAHGTFGQVLKVDGMTVVIKGREGVEKIVIVSTDTDIRKLRDAASISDIKPSDFVTVIGEPNEQGQLIAQFIRVMPPPPTAAPLDPTSPTRQP